MQNSRFSNGVSSYGMVVLVWAAFLCCLTALLIAHDVRAINADTFNISIIFRDLTQWGGSLKDWNQPGAPFFFPDIAEYFIVGSLIANTQVAIVAASIVNIVLYLIGWALVARAVLPAMPARPYTRFIPVLFAAATFLLFKQMESIMTFVFQPGKHIGLTTVTPYALALILVLTLSPGARPATLIRAALLFALSVLMVMSDLLYVIQVVAPALVLLTGAAGLRQLRWRQIMPPVITLLAGGIAGVVFARIAMPKPAVDVFITHISPGNIVISIRTFIDWFVPWMGQYPVAAVMTLGALAYHLAYLVSAVRRIIRRQPASLPLILLSGYAVLSGLASVVGTVGLANFPDIYAVRYMAPFFWNGLYALAIHGAGWIKPAVLLRLTLALAILLVAFALPTLPGVANLSRYSTYYPPLTACLDKQTEARHLTNGVAHYWDAIEVTMTARRPLHVMQVLPSLLPFLWVSNTRWYDRFPPEFLILDHNAPAGHQMSESIILARLGSPADRFECPGHSILVYNRPTDRLAGIMADFVAGK